MQFEKNGFQRNTFVRTLAAGMLLSLLLVAIAGCSPSAVGTDKTQAAPTQTADTQQQTAALNAGKDLADDPAAGTDTDDSLQAIEPGPGEAVPAGVSIPTDEVTVGKIKGDLQQVRITLTDKGFSPAVIVLQAEVETKLTIDVQTSADLGDELIFPALYTKIPLEAGDISIYLNPTDSFDFSTGDNAFYGYVKVVGDIRDVNIDDIKAEAGNVQTLIYPSEYFEESGASCH